MKIQKHLSQGIISLKFEFISTLSFEAQGILSQMVNLPDCDYISIKNFSEKYPTMNINKIKNFFNELEKKNYVFKTSENIYAVNKILLLKNMKWVEPTQSEEVTNVSY